MQIDEINPCCLYILAIPVREENPATENTQNVRIEQISRSHYNMSLSTHIRITTATFSLVKARRRSAATAEVLHTFCRSSFEDMLAILMPLTSLLRRLHHEVCLSKQPRFQQQLWNAIWLTLLLPLDIALFVNTRLVRT